MRWADINGLLSFPTKFWTRRKLLEQEATEQGSIWKFVRGASLNLLCPYSELTSTFLVPPLEHLSRHLSKVASHLEGQLYSYLQALLRTLRCDSLESALNQPAPVSTTAEPLLGPQKQCIQPHRTSHTFPSEIVYFPSSQQLDNDLPTPAHRTYTSVYSPSSPPASV